MTANNEILVTISCSSEEVEAHFTRIIEDLCMIDSCPYLPELHTKFFQIQHCIGEAEVSYLNEEKA